MDYLDKKVREVLKKLGAKTIDEGLKILEDIIKRKKSIARIIDTNETNKDF